MRRIVQLSPRRVEQLLALLSLDPVAGPEVLRLAEAELSSIAVEASADEFAWALASARADRNAATGEWRVPGYAPPTGWAFDDLQDVLSRAGLRGTALWAAWGRVKGHLRQRWRRGVRSRPADALVLEWALPAE